MTTAAWTAAIGFQTLFGDRTAVGYDTIATFAQLLANHPIANRTLGMRYEYQGWVGGSLVPRTALTKVFGPLLNLAGEPYQNIPATPAATRRCRPRAARVLRLAYEREL